MPLHAQHSWSVLGSIILQLQAVYWSCRSITLSICHVSWKHHMIPMETGDGFQSVVNLPTHKTEQEFTYFNVLDMNLDCELSQTNV
jgi:hypothetical protein